MFDIGSMGTDYSGDILRNFLACPIRLISELSLPVFATPLLGLEIGTGAGAGISVFSIFLRVIGL